MNSEEQINIPEEMSLPEALSYLMHSRIFEILGYISILNKEELSETVSFPINKVEEITKKLLLEFHQYMEFFEKKAISANKVPE